MDIFIVEVRHLSQRRARGGREGTVAALHAALLLLRRRRGGQLHGAELQKVPACSYGQNVSENAFSAQISMFFKTVFMTFACATYRVKQRG